MANYPPVLLVSVTPNSTTDDSSVSTLPRGQVDYLSHDWEEEDVWRSWRNMTRQKNEIANGIRLENASWRTWWKRRNGLGTVTPETLNWLKDSDVTWLYGPLHTAVDWMPPSKPIPDSTDPSSPPTSLNDNATTHKPILKHRSISQILTSDLPTSPKLTSPSHSDEDIDHAPCSLPHASEEQGAACKKRRPPIPHAKSDTHIMCWGSGRDFRRDSPLPIDLRSPPLDGVASSNASSDSNPAVAYHKPHKKRHISFNTFVEQYIAIEKPKKGTDVNRNDDDDEDDDDDSDVKGEGCGPQGILGRYPYGRNAWGYDDGYEEDEEEDSAEEEAAALSLWDEGYEGKTLLGSDSDSFECDEGESNDDAVVRLPSYDVPRPKKSSLRSPSTISNASSSSSASTSTSASTASTSSCSSRPQTRPSRRSSTSTTSTYRPRLRPDPPPSSSLSSSKHHGQKGTSPLIHPSSGRSDSLPMQSTHVTIAPIAPTILKTGTRSHYGAPGGWVEGFGDEGGSDDGLWTGADEWWDGRVEDERKTDGSGTSEGTNTPVELVFVPPLGSHYMHSGPHVGQREGKESGDFSTGTGTRPKGDRAGNQEDIYRSNRRLQGDHVKKFSIGDDADLEGNHLGATIPKVNIQRPPGDADQYDTFDITGGIHSDEYPRRSGGSERKEGDLDEFRGPSSVVAGASWPDMDQSRSRSRSRSRTPSPAIVLPTTSRNATIIPSVPLVASPDAVASSLSVVHARKSASISPPSSALLSPPLRGRGSRSHQDLQSQTQTRGRSNTRTVSTDRERSLSQYSSSLGSLSPEGVELGAAYASGRLDKEWEREKRGSDRDRSRGRERTGSGRLNQSLSPQDNMMNIATVLVPTSVEPASLIKSAASSSSSSSSSTATVMPSRRELSGPNYVLSGEGQVNSQPTPSNSPILSMCSVSDAVTRHSHYPSKPKSPIQVPAPHPVQPSTSYSISIPRIDPSSPTSPRSPSSPTRSEATIVGKAVGIVSSAGAFLGLWQHVGE